MYFLWKPFRNIFNPAREDIAMTASEHHPPTDSSSRRTFLGQVAAGGAVAGLALEGGLIRAAEAKQDNGEDRRIVVGVMGLSRGRSLANTFGKSPNVSIKYLCDVDTNRANACVADISKIEGQTPKPIEDFRRILDDEEVDVLVCAAPTIGTPRRRYWAAPIINMFTSKSPAATIRTKAK